MLDNPQTSASTVVESASNENGGQRGPELYPDQDVVCGKTHR